MSDVLVCAKSTVGTVKEVESRIRAALKINLKYLFKVNEEKKTIFKKYCLLDGCRAINSTIIIPILKIRKMITRK